MMANLEGPDDMITLKRASEINGVARSVRSMHAHAGCLQMVQVGWHRFTTRRNLHRYLMARPRDKRAKPLPADYVVPE
jgi:hypothetical protein